MKLESYDFRFHRLSSLSPPLSTLLSNQSLRQSVLLKSHRDLLRLIETIQTAREQNEVNENKQCLSM
uniref:Uncharacterized protein n=1 Tax=Caenorhabditis tropicalis TaxID=1561998 RepID=A0A1I7V3T0_9PELO